MDLDRHPNVFPIRALPTAPVSTVQGTLALDLQPRHEPPHPAPPREQRAGDAVPVDLRRRRQVEQWAHRFAQAAVEIVGGDRPATQLLRWTSGEVYADLHRRALLVAQAGGHQPGVARVQPVSPKVLSVRTCFVTQRVVETGIHVRYGARSRALAARFELRTPRHETGARWLCTALQFA